MAQIRSFVCGVLYISVLCVYVDILTVSVMVAKVSIGFYVNNQNVGSRMLKWTKKKLQHPQTIVFFGPNT
jgi:Na+/H+ antiporter NhaB